MQQYRDYHNYYNKDDGFEFQSHCDPSASFGCLVSSGRKNYHGGAVTVLADVLPETAFCDGNSYVWMRTDAILTRYWSPGDGLVFLPDKNSNNDDDDDDDGGNHQWTYGEVTPLGVRQLAYEMGISECDSGDNFDAKVKNDLQNATGDKNVVFYDLGSGVGRLVTQMYLDQPHRLAKAIGIELSSDRHAVGAMALEDLSASEEYPFGLFGEGGGSGTDEDWNPQDPREKSLVTTTTTMTTKEAIPMPVVQLIHGNALEVDLDPSTTHVYISSLCFPEEVLSAIQSKLLISAPVLRVVAALNRLELLLSEGDKWEEKSVPIQMSWGDGLAKIYSRKPTER